MQASKNPSIRKMALLPSLVRSCFDAGPAAAGCALLPLLLAAGAVQAQETAPAPAPAPAAELESITVSGIRASIEKSIDLKRDSDSVTEVLTAEDIGKLPDTTIAESLARLPGLTTQRDQNGQATNINIRGLGPDFNGYLLNGREQTSTGDSRAVDLSVYPAELIGGATVYKTTDASVMTAGLAGTIDNHLIDPLQVGHRVLSVQYDKTRTSVGNPISGAGKRDSLAYIDQFFDRKIGVALGYVHSDSTSSSLANGSWGNNDSVTTTGGQTSTINVPWGGGLSFETDHLSDRRNGFAAILEFRPNSDLKSEFDFYHALQYTAKKVVAVKGATNGSAITNATVSNGVVTSGDIALAPGAFIGYSENVFDDDRLRSLGWKTSWNFADGWTGSVDLNHNSARRDERDIEAYAHTTVADTLSFTNGGSSFPQFSVGNPALYTSPSSFQISDQTGWSGVNYLSGPYVGQEVPQAGYLKGPTTVDALNGARLALRHSLGDGGTFSDLQFGLNFTRRTKDRYANEGLILSANDGGYDRIPMPAGSYVENNVGGTGLSLLTFDPTGIWGGAALQPKFNNDILSKTWTVLEKVTTGYLKADIDTKLWSLPVTGNVGAQVVNTDQSSQGFRADASSAVSLTNPAAGLSDAGVTYTDVLPSLNLRGDLGSGNVLRLGLAEQIARPTLTDMRNSLSVAVDGTTSDKLFGYLIGSAGNPNLKPFKAKTLDLSYEKYFGNKAYLSAAAFYKKLDTYIVPYTYEGYDFTQIAQALGITVLPKGPYGEFTSTVNGHGGNLRGIELSASLPFSLLTKYLEGFGMLANYSVTSSSVVMPNLIGLNPTQPVVSSPYPMSLPGLSKTNDKVEWYFERWGLSAFWAVNHRSDYVASVANRVVGGYPAFTNIGAQTWVSAQIGYEVQTGYLKGLGIRFEGNNINKPIYREFNADGSPSFTNQTGASYGLRFIYKFQQ